MTKLREILSTASILIVDDDSLIRELLVEAISAAGGEDIAEARNGSSAMQIGAVLPFDLVITDLVMPEVEGIELIRWFQRVQPKAKIIAMSGAHGGAFLAAARLLGANAVIHKPFSIDVLLAVVLDVLSPGEPRGSDPTPGTVAG